MTNLRNQLNHLAEQASPPTLDPALWDRGRRLRRRDRLATSATALVVVLLVGGLTSLVVGPSFVGSSQVAAPAEGSAPEGAIPSRIEEVPQHVGPGTGSLDIGRASVAFGSTAGTVLVSATDGRYHRVRLPQQWESSMRLSPDGRQLAYVFATPSQEEQGTTVAGVAVVDLSSGEVEQVPATNSDDQTVDVASIGWSTDSTRVAWWGYDVVSWGDMGPVRATTGTMGAIDTTSMAQVTTTAQPGAVSVSDAGTITLVNREAQTRFDTTTSQRNHVQFSTGTDVFAGGEVSERATTSADGSLTAVALITTAGAAPFVTRDGTVLQRTLPTDLYPRGARVTPLGWVSPSLVLAYVEPDLDAGPGPDGGDAPALALFTSPDRPSGEWTYRYVVRDLPDLAEISVAVDLIPDLDGTPSQQLTQDFPEPDWPMSPARLSLLIGLGVAAALSVLKGVSWLWRRRTSRV